VEEGRKNSYETSAFMGKTKDGGLLKMRYYEVHYPDGKKATRLSVRDLENLPKGTKIYAVITERDGTLVESWEIPVVNGKPSFKKTFGVRKDSIYYGR
jgi:hypothetical protein